jgi:MFS family permease
MTFSEKNEADAYHLPPPDECSSRTPHVPRNVWTLGFVSMFMDVSSEMIHSLLPVFVVSVLGASATTLGILEGVAEGAVNIVKIFSGFVSDRLGKRKALAIAGYGLAALTKPLFPLAQSLAFVFVARIIDRVGKGIREAPRDALIADVVSPRLRGASYGLRQTLDTIGAFAGPLSAMFLMVEFKGEFRLVFWAAVLPAFVSVSVLTFFVREPSVPKASSSARPRLNWRELSHFSRAFWFVVVIGAAFTLARFSEAFLLLRAKNVGLGDDYVPLVLVLMNMVYAMSSYPAGRFSDRGDRRLVLAAGAIALIAADIVLAEAHSLAGLALGVSLWGLHMGLSQSLLAALVADEAPADRRGTAFGLFNLATGVLLLAASILAGALWDRLGPPATFYAGASFAGLALLGLIARIKTQPKIARSPSPCR